MSEPLTEREQKMLDQYANARFLHSGAARVIGIAMQLLGIAAGIGAIVMMVGAVEDVTKDKRDLASLGMVSVFGMIFWAIGTLTASSVPVARLLKKLAPPKGT